MKLAEGHQGLSLRMLKHLEAHLKQLCDGLVQPSSVLGQMDGLWQLGCSDIRGLQQVINEARTALSSARVAGPDGPIAAFTAAQISLTAQVDRGLALQDEVHKAANYVRDQKQRCIALGLPGPAQWLSADSNSVFGHKLLISTVIDIAQTKVEEARKVEGSMRRTVDQRGSVYVREVQSRSADVCVVVPSSVDA